MCTKKKQRHDFRMCSRLKSPVCCQPVSLLRSLGDSGPLPWLCPSPWGSRGGTETRQCSDTRGQCGRPCWGSKLLTHCRGREPFPRHTCRVPHVPATSECLETFVERLTDCQLITWNGALRILPDAFCSPQNFCSKVLHSAEEVWNNISTFPHLRL